MFDPLISFLLLSKESRTLAATHSENIDYRCFQPRYTGYVSMV